jgi:hypothetical protein
MKLLYLSLTISVLTIAIHLIKGNRPAARFTGSHLIQVKCSFIENAGIVLVFPCKSL